MKRVRFLVPRDVTYSSDVAFELYGDLGSGTVDFTRPLPPGRVRLWPEGAPRTGHLRDGHLMLRHVDSVDVDGHLEGTHLWDGHLQPVLAVVVDSPRYVFGRFRHAIRMFDGAGNTSAQAPVEHVQTINAAPSAPRGLKRVGWDGAGQRLLFSFDPVRFNAVAGG